MDLDIAKGGHNWGHIEVSRRSKGIEICATLNPKIEELIQSASEAQGSYNVALESYGRGWVGLEPTPSIKVYALERPIEGPSYTLGNPCGPLKDGKGKTNLSFLAFVGIGKPEGVRFMILGPAQADAVKEYARNVVKNTELFLREYLIPIHFSINISVDEGR